MRRDIETFSWHEKIHFLWVEISRSDQLVSRKKNSLFEWKGMYVRGKDLAVEKLIYSRWVYIVSSSLILSAELIANFEQPESANESGVLTTAVEPLRDRTAKIVVTSRWIAPAAHHRGLEMITHQPSSGPFPSLEWNFNAPWSRFSL